MNQPLRLEDIDGVYSPLREGRPPNMAECLACNSIGACETARLRVASYKNAVKLQNAEYEISQLQLRLMSRENPTAVRGTIVSALLLLMITCSLSDMLPDIPRRPRPSRKELLLSNDV